MQTDLCRGNVQPVRTGKCHVPCEKSSCTCNYFCSRTGWLGRVLGGYFALETERQKCVFFGVVRGSSVQTFLVLSQSKRPFSMDGPWGIGNCKHLVNTQAVMLGHDIRFSWSNKLNFEHVPFVTHVYLQYRQNRQRKVYMVPKRIASHVCCTCDDIFFAVLCTGYMQQHERAKWKFVKRTERHF